MIKSMTGFAQTVSSDDQVQLTVSVRTYNNRFLDTNLRLNTLLYPLEDRVKSYIASRVSRGRVDLAVQMTAPEKTRNQNLAVNWPLAESYHLLLSELKAKLKLGGSVSLGDLLSLKEVIFLQESSLSEDLLWGKLAPLLKKVFDALQKMRSAEGRHLARDLSERLQAIQERAETISGRIPRVIEAYRHRLQERVRKWTQGLEVDDQRLAQEVAFMVDRSDISEELVRLGSHIKQFKSLLKDSQPVGKKMEFLLQEMNREVNTIGSKSLDSEISHQVVAVKAELEKMREQVQNIE
ncbi:MAG: YicC/YloC family endoribonuclease [Thermodesulfobacteriota bacterium]